MNVNLMNLTQEDIETVIEARKEKARDQRLEELFEEVKNDLDEIYELGGRVLGESYGGHYERFTIPRIYAHKLTFHK